MSVSPDTSMMCTSERDSESDGDGGEFWVWLDELCLEPITSVHGCSRLCNACLRILKLSAAKMIGDHERMLLRHLRYWTTLRSSAERGCLLCIRLLDRWKGSEDDRRATALVESFAFVRLGGHEVFFQSSMLKDYEIFDLVSPACKSQSLCNPIQMLLRHLILPVDPIPCLNDRVKCSPSTSSPESRFLAGSWLQYCLDFHGRCTPDTEHSKDIPARLIDIKLTDRAPTLCLIETGGQLREERHYMTLSYCWGDALFPTLRIDNEQQLKNNIAFETLPKVFQDVIHIAGWFQLKYLWIDSLCIIQDSHDDWIRESCKMKHIYRNSFLTVAATGATDPSRGCFRDRNPSLVEPIKYRIPNEKEEYIAALDGYSYQEAIHSSPLSKRAWAFQERLLSPRVLHFGEEQLHWECNEMSACETCPGGIQPKTSRKWSQYCTPSVAKGQLMTTHNDFLGDVWSPIISSYSTGALTKFSDKCLAISGIVEQAQSLYKGTYMAGLWRENFEVQLLWGIDTDQFDRLDSENRPTVPCKRPATYVAPSWSWLSVDGPITLYSDGNLRLLLDIVDIQIELSNRNEYGTIKKGRLQARGWLSAGTWEASETREDLGHCGELRSIRGHPCDMGSLVAMDTAEETEEVVCLPVGWNTVESNTLDNQSDLASTHGLLLTKTGAKSDEYRRIGRFRIDEHPTEKEVLQLFFQQRLKNGRWRKRRKTTFTIV